MVVRPRGVSSHLSEFSNRECRSEPKPRRFVVARRFISEKETQPTLFALGRYVYRAWVTNLSLTPAGVWYFYDGRAAMEPRIGALREDTRYGKSLPVPSRLTLSTWRSSASPITWSLLSSAPA
jgi:hypothetical protein